MNQILMSILSYKLKLSGGGKKQEEIAGSESCGGEWSLHLDVVWLCANCVFS